MPINIRKAIETDCPRLLELIKELALYERAPHEVTVNLEHFIESGFGENPVWWAIVATSPIPYFEGDIIHGFALYYIRYSTWKGQVMYLEDIIVTEEERQKGIGKMLMNGLIQEAKEKKLNRICWQVLEWNKPAINFYKGFSAKIDSEWLNCYIDINQ